jgi:threonylcarbamoyladenosine tRNA methylthiotransferase MtaB
VNVFLHTFGCKANQYDTEAVRQRLEAGGCTIVDAPERADAAVVNSCTVTHVGEAKLRRLVRGLARRRPEIRTVVMGCAAALDDGRLARLPSVAAVVGGADAEAVARAVETPAPRGSTPAASGTAHESAPPREVRDGLAQRLRAAFPVEPLRSFARSSRAWLKVQEGCDEHCTFCATTVARGANLSRPPEAVIAEARLLARAHAEIVLTGVHIGSYGRDLDGDLSLGALVRRLVEAVPDVRFRLSSIEATELCADLEQLLASAPDRLAPHLHAPLQSGSDRVLKRMGRHWYTAARYRERLEHLAARTRVLGLGADVIVGFPGESDADHRATVNLVEALPFTYLHVFPYSPRAGTAAPRLGAGAGPDVVRERGAELRHLAARKAAAHRLSRAGGRADLVLEDRRQGWREALTEDYLAVQVPADESWVLGRARIEARLVMRAGRLMGEAA